MDNEGKVSRAENAAKLHETDLMMAKTILLPLEKIPAGVSYAKAEASAASAWEAYQELVNITLRSGAVDLTAYLRLKVRVPEETGCAD